jgi:hypothetical protein
VKETWGCKVSGKYLGDHMQYGGRCNNRCPHWVCGGCRTVHADQSGECKNHGSWNGRSCSAIGNCCNDIYNKARGCKSAQTKTSCDAAGQAAAFGRTPACVWVPNPRPGPRPDHTPTDPSGPWRACTPSVAGTDVHTCPLGQPCKRAGQVGKFLTWVTESGQTQCHCLLDSGIQEPCHGPVSCECKGAEVPLVTPAPQLANEVPDEVSAGGKKFELSGADGCPCSDDHTHGTPTKKSQQACAQHCASTSSCDVFYWNDLTTDCWLSQSVFVVHADSFCPGKQGSFCYTFMHFPA